MKKPCIDCGKLFERKPRSSSVRCKDCRVIFERTYMREWRRKQRGTKLHFAEIASCIDCGVSLNSPHAIRCGNCNSEFYRTYYRNRARVKNRTRPEKFLFEIENCIDCGGIKTNPKSPRCVRCRLQHHKKYQREYKKRLYQHMKREK